VKFQDKKPDAFDSYLKRNRPEAPQAAENESQKIWAAIYSASSSRTRRLQAWSVCSVVFSFVVLLSFFALKPHEPQSLSENEVALISESLDLSFLEVEDMNEVAELVSLVD